jgi:hypothetical protein
MPLKVAIIGGGHLGVVLGLALLDEGYETSIFTQNTPAELRAGRILSSQCTWSGAAAIEARWAPQFWENEYRGIGGFRVRVADAGTGRTLNDIEAPLDRPGYSVDQRMKVSWWLEKFVERGGTAVYGRIATDDLPAISDAFDLVVVCAGKFRGDLGDVFPVDPDRSRYDTAQRIGAVVFLDGRDQKLSGETAAAEEWSVVPGIGDFFAIPAYAERGLCHVVCMEGFVGGPLDQFAEVRDAEEILRRTRAIFEQWLPWERGRWDNARLTDAGAAICGGFVPAVRKPVATLPNGRRLIAFADAHILMDPLTAQGANTHIKNLPGFVDAIREADGAFNEEWMHRTAERNWTRAERIEAVQEQYLNPRDHLWSLFDAAHRDSQFGDWWVKAHFERPEDLLPWIESREQMEAFLLRNAARPRAHG